MLLLVALQAGLIVVQLNYLRQTWRLTALARSEADLVGVLERGIKSENDLIAAMQDKMAAQDRLIRAQQTLIEQRARADRHANRPLNPDGWPSAPF